jgi:hypothetical protein
MASNPLDLEIPTDSYLPPTLGLASIATACDHQLNRPRHLIIRIRQNSSTMPPLPIEEYQVGWVYAPPKELTAARAILDEEHEQYKSQIPHDNNNYVLGRIHGHNMVTACVPAGVDGTASAATVANNMLRIFHAIRFGLMVGIGGGIPDSNKGVDIRLGDMVVSQPDGTHGGVVQYDLRKNLGDGPELLLTV